MLLLFSPHLHFTCFYLPSINTTSTWSFSVQKGTVLFRRPPGSTGLSQLSPSFPGSKSGREQKTHRLPSQVHPSPMRSCTVNRSAEDPSPEIHIVHASLVSCQGFWQERDYECHAKKKKKKPEIVLLGIAGWDSMPGQHSILPGPTGSEKKCSGRNHIALPEWWSLRYHRKRCIKQHM